MKKFRCLFFVLCLSLCLGFASITKVNASTYQTSDKIEVKGAQIRTTGNAGIRFVGTINDYDDSNVDKYGIVLAYGVASANDDFVIGGEVNGKDVVKAEVLSTDNGDFLVTLYNIPESQYGKLVSARAYVIEGENVIYSSSICVRSLAQVALAAIEGGDNDAYLTNVIEVVNSMYDDVEVTFDSEDISFTATGETIASPARYTLNIATYKNGLYNNGNSVYIDDAAWLKSSKNGSSFIYANKLLVKYDEKLKAYEVVAKAVASGSGTPIKNFNMEWDFAILYLKDAQYNSIELGQYIVFGETPVLGMSAFDANVYNKEDFVSKTKTFKIPELLPVVFENEVANTAWRSSVDEKLYTYFPGYKDSVKELTYSPVWYYPVNVTFDYAGNLGYASRSAMVNEFVKDFNAFCGTSVNADGTNFFDRSYSSTGNYGYEFLTSNEYSNKWGWMLDYINSVRIKNSKAALQASDWQAYARGEIHNFLNASAASSYGSDYSNEEVANGYLKLNIFKVEEDTYLLPTSLPIASREGYEFIGWVSSLDGETYISFPAYETNVGEITYSAKWVEKGALDMMDALNCVSDVVTSNTVDTLLSEYQGYSLTFTSSNNDLYTIKNGKGYTNRVAQTHKAQTVTISLKATKGNEVITLTKEIKIDPVLFDDMTNAKAVYFAVSSATSYTNNSERYKEEGTMFSEKFRNNMDMVYYSFAVPQEDGSLTLNTKYIDTVNALKNDGIRTILVIDGANKAPLQAMVKLCDKDNTRKTFVDNIMDLVKTYNFDGVDVDWEFPGISGVDTSYYTTQRDQANLNKLLRDLRNEFNEYQDPNGSPYILSVAIPSSSWGAVRYDFSGSASKSFTGDNTLGGINEYCDYVNMMSYDLNNGEYTTHVASCYSSTQSHDYKFGCVYGTDKFVELGLDKSKVILGTAAYGKAYKVTGTVDMNATYPALNVAGTLTQIQGVTGSYASGTIYYSGIAQLIASGRYTVYAEYNKGNIVGSYLYSASDNIFVTYDSAEAVSAKCAYAKANGLGIMVWAYGEDATDTIVDTICDNLK